MAIAEMTGTSAMRDVLEAYPGAQRALMRRYHIGGCRSCGFAPDDRLGDVLAKRGVLNIAEVIAHIRTSHEQEERIQMSPQELAEALIGPTPPRLIDVRGADEQALAKIDGALPVMDERAQEMMASGSKDTPIVLPCHHGVRSLDAASHLIGHGFTNVRSLRGGIDAWAEQIDPSVARYS